MEKGAVGGKKVLEAIILSVFQNSDCGNTGFVKSSTFWQVYILSLSLIGELLAEKKKKKKIVVLTTDSIWMFVF